MKWDLENDCSIEGTYKPLKLPGSVVMDAKRKCEETMNGLYVPDTIASYFEDGSLTIDDFFLQHRHKELGDILDMEVLLLLSSTIAAKKLRYIYGMPRRVAGFPKMG